MQLKSNAIALDTLLVNGEESPEFFMAAGQTERWRLVNLANARYFHLSLGGHPFRIIATDSGLIDHPVEAAEAPRLFQALTVFREIVFSHQTASNEKHTR